MTLSRQPALKVKVMEIQSNTDPAVLWLRAPQLCYLGGHAPQSGDIVGLHELQDGMPADLADSLEADEEDRKSEHATLVAATENEVATLTATRLGWAPFQVTRRRPSGRRSARRGEPTKSGADRC